MSKTLPYNRLETMKPIITHLWFDKQAEDAVAFYCSVFPNSKKGNTIYYNEEAAKMAQMPAGSVLTIDFELDGKPFVALNGGPAFKFTEAISLMIPCESQEELDHYWDKLSEGGEVQYCGWLKDKFGLSWQVVPAVVKQYLADPDPERVSRVVAAIMNSQKLDFATIEAAAAAGVRF